MEITPEQLARIMGHRIAELRRAAGLTQKEVADRADMDLEVYKRIERGDRGILFGTVATVLTAMGALPTDLITLRENERPRKPSRPRKKPEP